MSKARAEFQAFLLLMTAMAVLIFRWWTSFCFFPLPEWNSIRLAPTFMLRVGQNPYPILDGGPVTTWIYGPLTLLINLPTTLAGNGVSALLLAGAINLLVAIIPAVVAIAGIVAAGRDVTRVDRLWAVLLCFAVWPNTSLHYIQADNVAVAFGLLSNVWLARSRTGEMAPLVFAALTAALAFWSKQTALGLVLGQVAWLMFTRGFRAGCRYAGLYVACGAALGVLFVAWFGLEGLWLNLIEIPARLPWCASFAERTRELWMHIAGYVVVPALGLVVFRKSVWKKDSIWLLPAFTWLCLVPTAATAIYKVGGATNSLNAFLYLLPPAAFTLVLLLKRLSPREAYAWSAACVLGIVTQQLASSPLLSLRPLTGHLRDAEYLAANSPGRIYFPWHPLVTFFSEKRFYHTEDGLATRELAGVVTSKEAIAASLPPRWSQTAILGWREQGFFRRLQPPSADKHFVGKWTLYAWPPSEAAAASETRIPQR